MPALQPPTQAIDTKEYVLKRYEDRIAYYWRASLYNKRCYKSSRFLTIVLGAVVTLISSMASAGFVRESGWAIPFAVATPVMAALLAIAGGLSQSFQWGAVWSEMVLTAEGLEKERDRIKVTAPSELNAAKELETLNNLVITESRGFFGRILGSGNTASSSSSV